MGIKINKWIACPAIGVLIAMGTDNSIMTYLAALLAAACILLYNEEDALCVLFFSVSFTHAFKSSPSSTSFFIMLLFLYVLWHLSFARVLHKVVGWIICLTGYVAVIQLANFSMGIELVQLVKFAMNLLFLYVAVQQVNYDQPRNIFLFYIFGVLIASLLKYSDVFQNLSLYTDGKVDIYRFTGMHEDPNYYGVNLVICLCLVVVMYHRRDVSIGILLAMTGLLVWFAALTVSKMVFLMLLMPILAFIYSNHLKRRYGLQVLSIIVLAILVGLVLSDKMEIFHSVLQRFEEASDAVSLTTGRVAEWKEYITYILSNPKVLILGAGLDAPSPANASDIPHNTCIDYIYNLGIAGTIGWACCVNEIFKISKRQMKKNFVNASVFVSMMIMWMALSELLYYDMIFHVLLAHIVWNISIENTRSDKEG